MADVFISYMSDTRPAADHLASLIRHHGYSVWLDYEGLRPGEGFSDRLREKVDTARAVVVLWGQKSAVSDWVRAEASWAKARGSYLPVKIERVSLPFGFHEDHTLSLEGWNGSPMDGATSQLLHAIGQFVGRQPVADFEALTREHQTWVRYGKPTFASLAKAEAAQDKTSSRFSSSIASPPTKGELWTSLHTIDGHGVRQFYETERGPLGLWHTEKIVEVRPSEVLSVSFSPDGAMLLTGSETGPPPRMWDVKSKRHLFNIPEPQATCGRATISPDGNHVLSFYRKDNGARISSATHGALVVELQSPSCQGASFSAQGDLVVAFGSKWASVYETATGQALASLAGHPDSVKTACFSPDGKRVVTACRDNLVRVFDSRTGELLRKLAGHANYLQFAIFCGSDRSVVSGDWNETVIQWDIESGALQRKIDHSGGTGKQSLTFATVSPDLEVLLTASRSNFSGGAGISRLWSIDRASRPTQLRLLHELNHPQSANCAAFSLDNQRLVTGHNDSVARVWNRHTGELIASLVGHTGTVGCVAFSPDCTHVATGSFDGTARLWRLNS